MSWFGVIIDWIIFYVFYLEDVDNGMNGKLDKNIDMSRVGYWNKGFAFFIIYRSSIIICNHFCIDKNVSDYEI